MGCQTHGRSDQRGEYQGTVEYEDRVMAFEVPGRVQSVDVRRGEVVERGRLLAALDDALARLEVESRHSEAEAAQAQTALVRSGTRLEDIQAAEARVAAARVTEQQLADNLRRDEALSRAGAKPAATVEDLRAQMRRAQEERLSLEHSLRALKQGARRPEIRSAAEREQALAAVAQMQKVRLARYRLVANADGVVTDVHAEAGEVVASGAPVITMADLRRPYAEVFVPEGEVTKVAVNHKASARVDGLSHPLSGRVEHIAARAEFTPRYLFSERERPNLVFRVRVQIDDPEETLRAGLPVFVTLSQPSKDP